MQASKQAGAPAISRRVVAATVIGNALEFYDFVTYAFFAVYIGKTFFPSGNEFISLLMSVAVFGVGFFTRPLGGILIGAYADRAGRKPAMLLTIVLITIGTLGLALTPSYESIGIAAPIIVVLARLIQGLALGGEIGPSSAFLIESAPAAQRGMYGSWQLASQGIAAAVAGGFGMVLAAIMSKEELQAWGWRIPFAVGLLLIPLAIYLRKSMPETLEHGSSDAPQEKAGPLLRQHARLITLALLALVGGTVSTYVNNYMTTFAITTLKFPPVTAMAATVVSGIATLAFSLLGGWLSDRFGRKTVMLVPAPGRRPADLSGLHVPDRGEDPGRAVHRRHAAERPDRRQRRLVPGRHPRAAAAPRARHRPVAGLRLRRHHLRRHHPAGRHLADRGHRQPGLAGLVRDHHQRRRRHRHVADAGRPRPEAELIGHRRPRAG